MLRKIKHITIGIIVGSLLTSSFALAQPVAEYVLSKVNYPILVEGKEYKDELPILNYQGNTYVPLRAIGEMFGSEIAWNSELGRVEIEKEQVHESITETNLNENITTSTFNGLRSIIVNGEEYFDLRQYALSIGPELNPVNTVDYVKEDNVIIILLNNRETIVPITEENFKIFNGTSYLHTSHYRGE